MGNSSSRGKQPYSNEDECREYYLDDYYAKTHSNEIEAADIENIYENCKSIFTK